MAYNDDREDKEKGEGLKEESIVEALNESDDEEEETLAESEEEEEKWE